MAYHTGSGVKRDARKALALFREAAASGSPLASYKLGCYYDGQGGELVDDDLALALEHKLIAAEAGYALAQQDVAAIYARTGDMEEAVQWLEQAAKQGWAQSLASYASIHNGAEGVTRDPVKTAAYFRLYLTRREASPEQLEWLREFEEGMSADQKQRADHLVRNYAARPTQITLTALSGERAAIMLVNKRGEGGS